MRGQWEAEMTSHRSQSLCCRDFPTFGVRGGGNSKKRTNVVAQTTLLKKYLYGMVNDRQLSTSLKNKANKLFISCSLCSFIYRPFALPKSVLSYDTYQSPFVISHGFSTWLMDAIRKNLFLFQGSLRIDYLLKLGSRNTRLFLKTIVFQWFQEMVNWWCV